MDLTAFVAALPWPTIGWGAVIAVIILLVLRGELVPRRVHEDLVTLWKLAYEKEMERGNRLDMTVDKLTDGLDTVVHIIESLPRVEEGRNDEVPSGA